MKKNKRNDVINGDKLEFPNVELIHGRKKKIDKSKTIFCAIMLFVPVLHFIVYWLYVNIDTLFLSFQDFNVLNSQFEWVGFRNYIRFFQEITSGISIFPTAMKNSIYFFLWNNFVLLPISIICAYFLFKKMPLNKLFRIIFFLPSIISIVVLTMLFVFMFDSSIGIVDGIFKFFHLEKLIPKFGWFGDKGTAMFLILIYGLWSGIGYNIVLFTGAITRIPEEIFESARMDGIGMFGELWYMVIPLIGTTVSTMFVFGTTVIFTMFLQPMLITNGGPPPGETYTIALYIIKSIRDEGNITLGATVGVIFAIIGTPLVIIVKKILEKMFPVYEY